MDDTFSVSSVLCRKNTCKAMIQLPRVMQDVYKFLISELHNYIEYIQNTGAAVAQWLRCCATNRKVADSIPDGVIGIFR